MTGRARRGMAGVLIGCAVLVAVPALDGMRIAGADAAPVPALGAVVISDVAPGYRLVAQGPLVASQFVSDAPDPAAAAGALSTLTGSVTTYERVWRADGDRNRVQDLLVRFPDPGQAQAFLQAAQRALQRGEIVSSDALPSIPGASRVTYFATTNGGGVGQAIAMRSGTYVDLLSFLSAAAGNARPLSPATTEQVAETQHAAMTRSSGGGEASAPSGAAPGGGAKGASAGTIGLAVLVVAILAAAVAAPALLRRRRLAQEAATASRRANPAPPPASAGDAVDDRRELSG